MSNTIFAGQLEYDECLLIHLKNAKTDVAAQLIKQACKENYKGGVFVRQKRQVYNECLLENLYGIESEEAIIEIKDVCEGKHF
jgi:hypothetical protein